MTLKVDRGQLPEWELELGGRWVRGPEDTRFAQVSGALRGPDLVEPAAGTVTLWPLRLPGGIVIGARRIALDLDLAEGRLVVDGDPGAPPYLMGITLSGRLDGRPAEPAADADAEADVRVWIAPAQVLELWVRLNF
jgi:hypothetical protein